MKERGLILMPGKLSRGIKKTKRFSGNVCSEESKNEISCSPGPLRILREEKGISQRFLARKLGLTRPRLERLESRTIASLSIADLEKICQGLECEVEEAIQRFYTKEKKTIMERSRLDTFAHIISYNDGVKICALVRPEKPYFVGVLRVQPQKEWVKESVITRKEIFIQVLQGNLLLRIDGKEHLFRENENAMLSMPFSYEIYNPHQFKELVAMIYVSTSHFRKS